MRQIKLHERLVEAAEVDLDTLPPKVEPFRQLYLCSDYCCQTAVRLFREKKVPQKVSNYVS